MLLAITWAWAAPVLLGVIAALVVHEAGHIVAALAVGLAPRLLLLGCGPTVLRLVRPSFTLILRLIRDRVYPGAAAPPPVAAAP